MTVSSAASRFFSVDKCPRTMTWAFFYAKKQSPLFVTLSKNTPIVYVRRKKLRRVQLWKRIIFNNRFWGCCLFFALSIFHYFYGVTKNIGCSDNDIDQHFHCFLKYSKHLKINKVTVHEFMPFFREFFSYLQ